MLTTTQKKTAEAIINLFETSQVLGDYSKVTLISGDTRSISPMAARRPHWARAISMNYYNAIVPTQAPAFLPALNQVCQSSRCATSRWITTSSCTTCFGPVPTIR